MLRKSSRVCYDYMLVFVYNWQLYPGAPLSSDLSKCVIRISFCLLFLVISCVQLADQSVQSRSFSANSPDENGRQDLYGRCGTYVENTLFFLWPCSVRPRQDAMKRSGGSLALWNMIHVVRSLSSKSCKHQVRTFLLHVCLRSLPFSRFKDETQNDAGGAIRFCPPCSSWSCINLFSSPSFLSIFPSSSELHQGRTALARSASQHHSGIFVSWWLQFMTLSAVKEPREGGRWSGLDLELVCVRRVSMEGGGGVMIRKGWRKVRGGRGKEGKEDQMIWKNWLSSCRKVDSFIQEHEVMQPELVVLVVKGKTCSCPCPCFCSCSSAAAASISSSSSTSTSSLLCSEQAAGTLQALEAIHAMNVNGKIVVLESSWGANSSFIATFNQDTSCMIEEQRASRWGVSRT